MPTPATHTPRTRNGCAGTSAPAPRVRALARALGDGERLVVFDDGEHVAGLGARITDLLTAAPGLRCLVTSRTPLDAAPGQQTYGLEGLALPPADVDAVEARTSE